MPKNVQQTLDWYETHKTTKQVGFNPDGMCLKVCRTARGIPSKYASAKEAQDATPKQHRITKIADLRAGMVLYYDDPKDSNRYGHIVTMIGRVKNADMNKLSDILVVTNSVKKGQLTTVRGDYFPKYWGDPFVFGATWLNGVELDTYLPATRFSLFHKSGVKYNGKYRMKYLAKSKRPQGKAAYKEITRLIKKLNTDPKFWRLRKVIIQYRDKGILDLPMLDEAIAKGFRGTTKRVREKIQAEIDALPKR